MVIVFKPLRKPSLVSTFQAPRITDKLDSKLPPSLSLPLSLSAKARVVISVPHRRVRGGAISVHELLRGFVF